MEDERRVGGRFVGAALVLLLVLVGATAAVGWKELTTLRIRSKLREARGASGRRLDELMSEIAAMGSPGLAALEQVAFARGDTAPETSRLREAALTEVWKKGPIVLANLDGEALANALAPFVGETIGLDRTGIVAMTLRALVLKQAGSQHLDDAAARAVADDPDPELVFSAEQYLSVRRACVLARARATRTCRDDRARTILIWDLCREDAPLLPETLAASSPGDPVIRVVAAAIRWSRHDVAAYETLVRALSTKTSHTEKVCALAGLSGTKDRRLALAIARIAGTGDEALSPIANRMVDSLLDSNVLTFEELGKERPKDYWLRYVETHARELPPQIDPESDAPIEPPSERR
ncbi:MAG TPA: hypothetical protein VFF73_20000 [Planctomycetota bacterium]|nr:hypothetical protein [Planctomycetota bacterium]